MKPGGTTTTLLVWFVRAIAAQGLMCAVQSHCFAQHIIKETIRDSNSEARVFKIISIAQSKDQDATMDFDARFSQKFSEFEHALKVFVQGYNSKFIHPNGYDTVEIAPLAQRDLEDKIGVGYQYLLKKQITSAIISIKSAEFNKGPVNSPSRLIQGRVPGLLITKPNGDPNGDFSLQLRGISTLTGNTEPLILIDGLPGANLNNIDPMDIETITILKDGSAAAIYGTRGSNGVILIQTKKGKEGKLSVEYNNLVALESLASAPSVMNADQYINAGGIDRGSQTDWIDVITRPALQQQHNLSLAGGTKGMVYRLSFNYKDVPGILYRSGFKQTNARMSLTQKALRDNLDFGFDLSATNRDQNTGFRDAFLYATTSIPSAPVYDVNNNFNGGYFETRGFDYFNPLAIINQNSNTREISNLQTNLHAGYKILKGLHYDVAYSYARDNVHGQMYFSKQSQYGTGLERNGLASQSMSSNLNDYFSSTLHYSFSYGKIICTALGGYDYQKFIMSGLSALGGDFITDFFTSYNLGAALDFQRGLGKVDSYKYSNKLIAFFGRFTANIHDTWFANLSIRREGSSGFGDHYKWGIFPAISAGVDLADLSGAAQKNQFKLRVGYGITGSNISSDNLSLWRFGPIGTSYYNGAYSPFYGPVSNPNPDLKWEKKAEINIGLDYSFFDDKVSGSLDFFNKKMNDLLYNFQVPVPPNQFPATWANTGKLNSSGLEALVHLNNLKLGNLKFTSSLNATFYLNNKLISISEGDLTFGSQGELGLAEVARFDRGNFMIRLAEGDKIGQIYGPVYAGVDGNGYVRLEDINGDGRIDYTSEDRRLLGNGLPTMTFGMYNSVQQGHWALDVFFRGVFGHSLVNMNRVFYEDYGSSIQNYNRILTKYSDPELKISQYSSIHVEKADFLRLDFIQIGYNLLSKRTSSKALVYFTANNLFTLSGYTGNDPEVRLADDDTGNPLAPGIDRRSNYLSSRSFSFGINLGF